MGTSMEVCLVRATDGTELLAALQRRGLACELSNGDGPAAVSVECGEADPELVRIDIVHALEDWVSERGLPFVPAPLDERRYVLRPPAG